MFLAGKEAAEILRKAGTFYLWEGRLIGEAVVVAEPWFGRYHSGNYMRIAAWVVALLTIVIGVVGIVAPDSLTMARQHLVARPALIFYVVGPLRIAMGLVLIVFAPRSKTPRILRAMGVIMALQGIVPLVIGIDRERSILQQEVMLGHAVLRFGAFVALASGCFIAFVVGPRQDIVK